MGQILRVPPTPSRQAPNSSSVGAPESTHGALCCAPHRPPPPLLCPTPLPWPRQAEFFLLDSCSRLRAMSRGSQLSCPGLGASGCSIEGHTRVGLKAAALEPPLPAPIDCLGLEARAAGRLFPTGGLPSQFLEPHGLLIGWLPLSEKFPSAFACGWWPQPPCWGLVHSPALPEFSDEHGQGGTVQSKPCWSQVNSGAAAQDTGPWPPEEAAEGAAVVVGQVTYPAPWSWFSTTWSPSVCLSD